MERKSPMPGLMKLAKLYWPWVARVVVLVIDYF